VSITELRGIGVSPGVAIGTALVVEHGIGEIPDRRLEQADVAAELARFEAAVEQARSELVSAEERAGREVGEAIVQIFDAQKMILEDRGFLAPVAQRIQEQHQNAERAVSDVGRELQARFARIDDPYLRERGADINTLTVRLLRILMGHVSLRLDRLTNPVILIAHDLSPAETAHLDRENVLAFVTDTGGRTSHTAIMARSLEIPAVVGTHEATAHVRSGDRVVLDGVEGLLIVSPDEAVEAEYRNKREAYLARELALAGRREQDSVTPDGRRISLHANLETSGEVDAALRHGAQGVGLFRSEFLYLGGDGTVPDEEAQFQEYRAVVEALAPATVTIRTLDLGGEKFLPDGLGAAVGSDGLLGLRGIRRSLQVPELFDTQLRALLRASAFGDLRIVLPFVTELDEVLEARSRIEEIAADLRQEGIACRDRVPVGPMLEIPAATLIVDRLAEHVDFFSIGTNDLIQYLLAVDRANDAVAHLYEPLHPGVLRILESVIREARAYEVPVSLCGEVASDPLTAMVLIGLGIDELSMAPVSIPVIKSLVRCLPATEAREIARRALEMRTAREVEEFALNELMAHFPDGFLVAGQFPPAAASDGEGT
jgi:phosphotransferase system enzyme I (PtsI)